MLKEPVAKRRWAFEIRSSTFPACRQAGKLISNKEYRNDDGEAVVMQH